MVVVLFILISSGRLQIYGTETLELEEADIMTNMKGGWIVDKNTGKLTFYWHVYSPSNGSYLDEEVMVQNLCALNSVHKFHTDEQHKSKKQKHFLENMKISVFFILLHTTLLIVQNDQWSLVLYIIVRTLWLLPLLNNFIIHSVHTVKQTHKTLND
jgi:hypothetical protein